MNQNSRVISTVRVNEAQAEEGVQQQSSTPAYNQPKTQTELQFIWKLDA